MTRNEIIGTACALGALALVAYLSYDSWQVAECRSVLLTKNFERYTRDNAHSSPQLLALKARLESNSLTEEEAACVKRIGSPLK